MYVKVTDGNPAPYSISQLREDNPQVSFPVNPPDSTLADFDVYPLTPVPRPSHDYVTQNLSEGTAALVDGAWTQVWVVSPATPDEIAARTAEVTAAQKSARADAYRTESDPLFFKIQRGEATMEEWSAKVEEIKARYPYPETEA